MDNYTVTITDEDGFVDTETIEAIDLEDAKEQTLELANMTTDEKENN